MLTSTNQPTTVSPSQQQLRDANFRAELTSLLNCYSKENGSNTPDFILAQFMVGCLATFDAAVSRRSEWYGVVDTHTHPVSPTD